MGLLSKLGMGPKDAAEAVVETAGGVADIVERWKPSEKAKHDMAREDLGDVAKNVEDARDYEPKSVVEGVSLFAQVANSFNVLVDGVNRLVRPTLAFTLMGALFSWWDVELNTKDPLMTNLSLAVFGFYFGVRGLTEDLPKFLRAIAEYRNASRKN